MKPRRSLFLPPSVPTPTAPSLPHPSIEPAPNQPISPPPAVSVAQVSVQQPQHPNPLLAQTQRFMPAATLPQQFKFNPISRPKLVRRLPKKTLIRLSWIPFVGDKNPSIWGMSYNSARDELFLADIENGVVRAMRVRDTAGDLRDVYRAPHDTSPYISSVCHMRDSDTLLVCSREDGPDGKRANWLVALSRNDSEWREAQRVQIDGYGWISCALSDSRVLIGDSNSTYMELFRVESGPRIARVHRIHVAEEFRWFSATCDIDTLVAMSYPKTTFIPNGDNSVRVHRLRGDRLDELARIQLKQPSLLLWLADRFLVADFDSEKKSDAVIELEMSDTRLVRLRELIDTSENIQVLRMCAVNDGLAIVDSNSIDILHYSVHEWLNDSNDKQ